MQPNLYVATRGCGAWRPGTLTIKSSSIAEAAVSNDKVLTVEDLITAFIEEAKFRNAHKDLSGYYKKRLDLLKELFECDLRKRQEKLDKLAKKIREQVRCLDGNFYEVSGEETIEFLIIASKASIGPNHRLTPSCI